MDELKSPSCIYFLPHSPKNLWLKNLQLNLKTTCFSVGSCLYVKVPSFLKLSVLSILITNLSTHKSASLSIDQWDNSYNFIWNIGMNLMLNVEVMKPVEASFVVPSSELKKEINVSECESPHLLSHPWIEQLCSSLLFHWLLSSNSDVSKEQS